MAIILDLLTPPPLHPSSNRSSPNHPSHVAHQAFLNRLSSDFWFRFSSLLGEKQLTGSPCFQQQSSVNIE